MSDEALLARVAEADERALAELYDRYGGPAYGLALRVVGDGPLAEDAVQEAFAAVWRSAGRFAYERGSARAWLLAIVHRGAVELLRRSDARRDNESVERTPALAALERLPPAQRRAIVLAFFGGRTHNEIAAELGEPVGAVKNRIAAGMSALRELLA